MKDSFAQIESGLEQLKKAEEYQGKNRKMKCILILAAIFVFLVILLVASKSWNTKQSPSEMQHCSCKHRYLIHKVQKLPGF